MSSAALILFVWLAGSASQAQEVVAEVRVQGNTLTPDADILQLAGITIGMSVGPRTIDEISARLQAAERFKRVEVLKRFASISDPSQLVLVVVVEEGPVKIEPGSSGTPGRVVRRQGLQLMYLPILGFEDGYGFTYGVRVSRPGPFGRRSQLSVPLTWGGDKRAAVQVGKDLRLGPIDRLETGASISRRQHPFYEQDEDRQSVWLTARRSLTSSLRASGTTGWQHVTLLQSDDGFAQLGGELVFDTRLDPMLARNAVFARVAWIRSSVPGGAVDQTTVDARGYLGLPGRSVVAVRGFKEDSDRPLPPYLKSMLGGMPNLRGFRRGAAVGDTLVGGSLEVRLPLTSPLRIGQFGVIAFVDAATTYDTGARLEDQTFERAVGGGFWFAAAFVRINVAVAHGIGGSTRVHIGTGVIP
jgi:outer membrane protein assembly factor BamA